MFKSKELYRLCLVIWLQSSCCLARSFYEVDRMNASDICTFESGLCGWTQEYTSSDFKFVLGSGEGKEPGDLRPSIDQTTGTATGKYMYAAPSVTTHKGDVARLVSPIYNAVLGTEVGPKFFMYYLYQDQENESHIMTFRVCIRPLSPVLNGEEDECWRELNALFTIANRWRYLDERHIPSGRFQIYFEAVCGEDTNSVIALDDFAVLNAKHHQRT